MFTLITLDEAINEKPEMRESDGGAKYIMPAHEHTYTKIYKNTTD